MEDYLVIKRYKIRHLSSECQRVGVGQEERIVVTSRERDGGWSREKIILK